MNVTVPSLTLDNWQHVGTVAKLRIFALQTFKSAENILVIGSSSPARDWYLELVCTVGTRVDGAGATIRTLTIPALQLPSTVDSDTPDARYSALFADDSGRVLQAFYGFEYFSLPASSPYTWQQIRAFNVLPVIPPTNWQTQVQALINASLPGLATPTTNGLMAATDKTILDGFQFEQATPQATWVVVHNLGRLVPGVFVKDSGGYDLEGSITYQSINQLTIQFSAPFSGVAYIGRG